MKISLNWLNDLVSLPWPPEAMADKLASLGFPVEKVTTVGVRVEKVVAAKILTVEKHPNADRLRIAEVEDGTGRRRIVCGAPNIAPGQIVPLALPGAHLPGGVEIAVSKIRGVESSGMLCSARELGISDEHAGIYLLPDSSTLGREVKDILGGGDVVLDVEVTPNRPDLLSHLGVARELAALAGVPLKPIPLAEDKPSGADGITVTIEEPSLCSRYVAHVLRKVTVAPSPAWMVQRLQACGIRSINNVVDITNYVLLEWGHPLHAFDLEKLQGGALKVRRAAAGEKLAALDERTYDLTADDLVIADAKAPVAIAGVMGGQPTGVTVSTKNVILESAVFDRVSVRKTSQRLGLRSESSYRFEKGTDPDTAEKAARRAVMLLKELAGASVTGASDVYPKPAPVRRVELSRDRLKQLLGMPVADDVVSAHLNRLGLAASATPTGWRCLVPPHRHDIAEDVDLIEEVVRLVGYHAVPVVAPVAKTSSAKTPYDLPDTREIVETLRGAGFSETITNSFCPADDLSVWGISPADIVRVANPLSKAEAAFRPLLAVNLARAVAHNANHQARSVRFFEIGSVAKRHGAGHEESRRLGLVWAGDATEVSWRGPARPVDAYALKGILELLSRVRHADLSLVETSDRPFLHPYQSFQLRKRGAEVGWAGLLHPETLKHLDIALPVAMAELDLAALLDTPRPMAVAIPKHSFVERDLAVLVGKDETWGALEKVIRKAAGPRLIWLAPFDLFSGGSLPANQKSVAFRFRLQDPEKALSEADITTVVDGIKTSLQKACGAQIRG